MKFNAACGASNRGLTEMTTSLTLESGDLQLRHGTTLECWAEVSSFRWDGFENTSLKPPELAQATLAWSLAERGSLFSRYREATANYGRIMPIRYAHQTAWEEAVAMLWASEPDHVYLTVCRPTSGSLDQFLLTAYASRLVVIISVPVQFAGWGSEQAPTMQAFANDAEPVIVRESPRFSLHRRNEIEDVESEKHSLLRHGRRWFRPAKHRDEY